MDDDHASPIPDPAGDRSDISLELMGAAGDLGQAVRLPRTGSAPPASTAGVGAIAKREEPGGRSPGPDAPFESSPVNAQSLAGALG